MSAILRVDDNATAAIETALEIGRRIRSQRLSYGVTQEVLAELAGVSVRFIGELERGKPTVRLNGVLAVCQVLGLELLPS